MRKQWYNYLDNIFKRQRETFKKSEEKKDFNTIKYIASNRTGKTPYTQKCDSLYFDEKEYYTVNAMGIWPIRLKKPEKKDLDK